MINSEHTSIKQIVIVKIDKPIKNLRIKKSLVYENIQIDLKFIRIELQKNKTSKDLNIQNISIIFEIFSFFLNSNRKKN